MDEPSIAHVLTTLRRRTGHLLTASTPVHTAMFERHCAHLKEDLAQLPADFNEPHRLAELTEEVCVHFARAVALPGTNVGILAGMALGEKQTQLTLNSFHSTGIACLTVVSGVTRFAELINVTLNIKAAQTRIPLTAACQSSADVRDTVGPLVEVRLGDLVQSYDLAMATSSIVFHLDPDRLYAHRVPMTAIARAIQTTFPDEVQVTGMSPAFAGRLTVRVHDRVMDQANAASAPWVPDMLAGHVAAHVMHTVIVPVLNDVLVAGTPGIKSMYLETAAEDQWTVLLQGANLGALLAVTGSRPDVFAACEIRSNHVHEIVKTLGIEAAREFLIQEFMAIVNADGSDIERRHVVLLVDAMCQDGSVVSVSRYGLRAKSSVLARCSFEESLENITRACMFSETEAVHSVSANIMAGKRARTGTGAPDLLYDNPASPPMLFPDRVTDQLGMDVDLDFAMLSKLRRLAPC